MNPFSFSKYGITDTCFWFAFFDKRDQYHTIALSKADLIESIPLAVPWPCLYETLNTAFLKDSITMQRFEDLLKRPSVRLFDDHDYRDDAFNLVADWSKRKHRTISLVDMVVRLMLEDAKLRIGYLFTFNPRDFIDVCTTNRIELPCSQR